MSCFAVIQVNQDQGDGYINGMTCVKTFPTESEAEDYIQSEQRIEVRAWLIREEYIEDWVDKIDIPGTDYQAWKELLGDNMPAVALLWAPESFKKNMTSYLVGNPHIKFERYNPPKAIHGSENLHVVEIKNE